MRASPSSFEAQKGSTLVVSLVALLALMLLAIAAMRTGDVQLRLAGNLQFQTAALGEAETATAQAEAWLVSGSNFRLGGFDTYSSATSPELYPSNYLASHGLNPLTMAWDDTNSKRLDASGNQRYLVERLAENRVLPGSDLGDGDRASTGCNMVNVYRISARGLSGRGATRYVQTAFTVFSC